MMVTTNLRCPHCGGAVFEEHDILPAETTERCINCGREVSSELSGPFPMDRHVPYQSFPHHAANGGKDQKPVTEAQRRAARRNRALRDRRLDIEDKEWQEAHSVVEKVK